MEAAAKRFSVSPVLILVNPAALSIFFAPTLAGCVFGRVKGGSADVSYAMQKWRMERQSTSKGLLLTEWPVIDRGIPAKQEEQDERYFYRVEAGPEEQQKLCLVLVLVGRR